MFCSPGRPQHRTLQPSGSAHGHTRIGDALDAIKQEYDLVAAELVQARTVRDEYEGKGAFHRSTDNNFFN